MRTASSAVFHSHRQGLPCPRCPPEGLTVGSNPSSPDRLPVRNHLATSRNTSHSGGRTQVKMREAWLFKSWSNSQTQSQLMLQGPLILGSRSVTLSRALCSFQWIDWLSFLLNSLICGVFFTDCTMWPCGLK